MKRHVRAVVAYVAARAITGDAVSAIYDYGERGYRSIDGSVDAHAVKVYDYVEKCYFEGRHNGDKYALYHYGDRHHVDLKIDGTKFEGYDFGSKSHFSGYMSGKSLSLYDYEAKAHFSYSL
jgi:hypothetical protein